jgi:hypothetical protein
MLCRLAEPTLFVCQIPFVVVVIVIPVVVVVVVVIPVIIPVVVIVLLNSASIFAHCESWIGDEKDDLRIIEIVL